MTPNPPLDPGTANAIIASLRIGDCVVVRAEYLAELRKVARMMGRLISVKRFMRAHRELYWLKRLEPLRPSKPIERWPAERKWRLVRSLDIASKL